tara:strand:+ start:552 stop:821 length:270 start_codon:yes stop_codon:yes gene_type:complete
MKKEEILDSIVEGQYRVFHRDNLSPEGENYFWEGDYNSDVVARAVVICCEKIVSHIDPLEGVISDVDFFIVNHKGKILYPLDADLERLK